MRNNFLTFGLACLLAAGCNSSEEVLSENQTTETNTQESQEPLAAELTAKQRLLGSWILEYDMEGTPFEITLTLNEDGSYSQTMAGNPVAGTWEMLDDQFMVVKNPNIKNPNGQKWQIVKSSNNELFIDWNIDGGEAKVLEFKRK